MEVVEFGQLTDALRAELQGDELDPFDEAGVTLRFRRKDRHVGLRADDGRLIASAGLLIVEIQVADRPVEPVVGIGGVIVAAAHRGQGLGDRIVTEALDRAAALGPALALLFCHPDRAGLYVRHGFSEVTAPVRVRQPGGYIDMEQVTMWLALRPGASLADGPLTLQSLPF